MEIALPGIHGRLAQFQADNLLTETDGVYKVTTIGRIFLRHIAAALDHDAAPSTFSTPPQFLSPKLDEHKETQGAASMQDGYRLKTLG